MKTNYDEGIIIGARIQQLRKQKGITMVELSKMLDVSQPTISKWEQGKIKNMRNSTIVRLSQILSCSPLYLIGLSDEIDAGIEPRDTTHLNVYHELLEAQMCFKRLDMNEEQADVYKKIITILNNESAKNSLIHYVDYLYGQL